MRKFAILLPLIATLGFLILIVAPKPAPAQSTVSVAVDPCYSNTPKSSASISLTSATTTQLVAPSGTTQVYVCGATFTIAPSGTSADVISFITGSGATCGTNTVTKTGTFGNGDLTTTVAVVPIVMGANIGSVFTAASGAGVCAVSAGTTVNIQGVMTYIQQ